MRFAMIFGKTHDGEVKVVGGPGLPSELNATFKKMAADTHPEFSELHFHEMSLGAGRKRMSFRQPAAAETGFKKDSVNTIAAARRAKTSA
jgi:hypothetical protein